MLDGIPLFLGLGIVGLSNLSLLCLIAMWRTYIYINDQRRTRKKVVLHVLLVLAVLVDLPMYVSFVINQDYNYITYSFHKFQPMFLLAAYSITINDWSSVLYSIQEIKRLPLVFRTGFLVFLNAIFSLFCILNFILIIAVKNVDKYTGTLTYKISIVLQIVIALSLTLFMLHAGLGLSRRLQGVSGMLASEFNRQPRANTHTGSPSPPSSSSTHLSVGFKTALNRLIVVMTTCSICIFIQLTLMIINYTAGYAEDKNKSPGPPFFYWTFYAWLPLWGPILAMLHLSRSRVHKAADDDYDTTSHRPARGGRGGKREYAAAGEGSETLLHGEQSDGEGSGHSRLPRKQRRGSSNSLREGGSGHGRHSLSHQSHLSSHHSHQSVASSVSVYRPPDYPSSLFRQHTGEQSDDEGHFRDDASSQSDSLLYMLGESDRERESSQSTSFRYSQQTDLTERTTSSHRALSGDYLNDDRDRDLEGREERGSSEDDYHHQYDTGLSMDHDRDGLDFAEAGGAGLNLLDSSDVSSLIEHHAETQLTHDVESTVPHI